MSDDRIGPYHVAIFTLCGACLIMDGFDVQAIGYVAPAIIQDWKIPAADMGPVFSAGLLGLFLGSLLFSMLGDRIGRRPAVLGATVAFSVLTLLTARVTSPSELIVMRVLAGLGLGAILPNMSLSLLFVVAFLAGLGIFAGQPGLNALAATFYPIEMRSTGIGAGLGIGRCGAFIGPLLAGELMRNQWTTQDLFHAAAIPAAISATAIVALRWTGRVA